MPTQYRVTINEEQATFRQQKSKPKMKVKSTHSTASTDKILIKSVVVKEVEIEFGTQEFCTEPNRCH